jgi:hypothetical protein
MSIRRTETYFDLARIRAVVEENRYLFSGIGVGITCRPGAPEPLSDACRWLARGETEADFSEIVEEFRKTAIAEFLARLPFRPGRTRLMIQPPKSCLTLHEDPTLRYHYAVQTNPGSFILFTAQPDADRFCVEPGTCYHIPADGYLYEMDARATHTGINTDKQERIHLVVCKA